MPSDPKPGGDGDEAVIPLLAEEVEVEKRRVETGSVRVTTATKESEQLIDEMLTQETAQIERIPIGRQVEVRPVVREEGDTLVIPIIEEVLVVERRLFLKEEVRIHRTKSTKRHQESVTVRRQEVVITRLPAAPEAAEDPSAGSTDKPTKTD